LTQTSRAGRLTGLPDFDLGLGLGVRPALTAGYDRGSTTTDADIEPSLDVQQRIGANLLSSLTVNTDFAETEDEPDTLSSFLSLKENVLSRGIGYFRVRFGPSLGRRSFLQPTHRTRCRPRSPDSSWRKAERTRVGH
jgi:hypothetical protein